VQQCEIFISWSPLSWKRHHPFVWTKSTGESSTWCNAKAPSTTTCWRRIQALEQSGVIKGRVALLDRAALGLDVTIFAHVKLSSQGRDAIAAFAEAIRERPEVLDCYTTMGEWDFMLRVVTRDIKAYEAFYLDHLSKLPNVQSINSSVTVTVIKETTILPITL
jgi:Lrp/AsnC family transcriptional regulator